MKVNAIRFGTFALLGILGIGLSAGIVRAQVTVVIADALARGHVEHTDVIGGPTEVVMLAAVFEPGARDGWHTHPGPIWAIVKSGELAVYTADGCRRTYTAGDAFVEQPDQAVDVRNETRDRAEVAYTALLPSGAAPQGLAAAPTAACS